MAEVRTDPGASGEADDAAPSAAVVSPAAVDCGLYVDGRRTAGTRSYAEALREAADKQNGFVWLGLYEPSMSDLTGIAETFGLHYLAVEDAVNAHQRPKLERYGDTSFLVVKTARYVEHGPLTATSDVVDTGELMLFIGPHFIVTVRHGAASSLDSVRSRLAKRGELLRHGPWAVAYAVLDRIVDDYLSVIAAVEDDVEQVEETVFAQRGGRDIQRIYNLKRELMELRRCVVPLSRPVGALASSTADEMAPDVPLEVRVLFRDVADHLARVVDQVNAFDDLLSSVLDATLAQIGIQQNNDMRKISAWVAIAAMPTMIAGIYGMNFHHMPELHWVLGYPLALFLMAAVCLTLYRAFRRSGWL